jgi:hypothetical protein
MCESDERKPEQIREDRYRTEAEASVPTDPPRAVAKDEKRQFREAVAVCCEPEHVLPLVVLSARSGLEYRHARSHV